MSFVCADMAQEKHSYFFRSVMDTILIRYLVKMPAVLIGTTSISRLIARANHLYTLRDLQSSAVNKIHLPCYIPVHAASMCLLPIFAYRQDVHIQPYVD